LCPARRRGQPEAGRYPEGRPVSTTHRILRLLAVLLICLLVPACKDKVTKANFDKIKEGMTLEEVQAILGKGEKQTGDGSNVAAQAGIDVVGLGGGGGRKNFDTWVWESGDKKITVLIRDNKVFKTIPEGLK
jgi:hypothetical protein